MARPQHPGQLPLRPAWIPEPDTLDAACRTGDRGHRPWFWLGTHEPSWLRRIDVRVPLFVSRRRLERLRPQSWPVAVVDWAMDSGGFTEMSLHGGWSVTPAQYAAFVREASERIGRLAWVAPMDAMCEPSVVAKATATGWLARQLRGPSAQPRGVLDHLVWTVRNFVELRTLLDRPSDPPVIPVVQGWELHGVGYDTCLELYAMAGVDLTAEPLVGVGSVCRRDQTASILEKLAWLGECGLTRLHGFGLRGDTLALAGHRLASADSMAWSYNYRRRPPLPGHTHKSCANCPEAALAWRERTLERAHATTHALREGLAALWAAVEADPHGYVTDPDLAADRLRAAHATVGRPGPA